MITFCNIWAILPENRTQSQVKGLESKFDKYYFIHTIPDEVPVKKFWFQFCSYRSQRLFQKIINPDFQVWLAF